MIQRFKEKRKNDTESKRSRRVISLRVLWSKTIMIDFQLLSTFILLFQDRKMNFKTIMKR